jgi:hypothetical protein
MVRSVVASSVRSSQPPSLPPPVQAMCVCVCVCVGSTNWVAKNDWGFLARVSKQGLCMALRESPSSLSASQPLFLDCGPITHGLVLGVL